MIVRSQGRGANSNENSFGFMHTTFPTTSHSTTNFTVQLENFRHDSYYILSNL